MKHELLEQMFDNNVRINKIIHVKGACIDSESPAQVLEDFYEDDIASFYNVEYLYKQWPGLYEAIGSDEGIPSVGCETFAFHLLKYCPFQFLVQIQHQIIEYKNIELETGRKTYVAGWGHYREEWCFANTMEEAAEFALECYEKHRKEREYLYFNPTLVKADGLPF